MKVPYILWLTTGALVSLTLTVNNLKCFFTPHAQRKHGKVIGVGVHIYVYMFVDEK